MALRNVREILFVATFVMIESSGPVVAMTYADWLKENTGFRAGYLFGVTEALSSVVDPSNETSVKDALSYQLCFGENKIDSQAGANIVESFLHSSPDAAATPMIGNIIQAFRTACSRCFGIRQKSSFVLPFDRNLKP
jgi:hypothetical protein